MRRFGILYRYIGKEFLLSFLVSFFFFFFIFFINQILVLAEQILAKNVSVPDMLRLIFYAMPAIIALAFPFATLIAGLMTMGHFSSHHEVIAISASGVPLRRIFIPLFVISMFFSVFSFFINDYFLPLGIIEYTKLYRTLMFRNPELELEGYSVKRYNDITLMTGAVEGNRIQNLMIIDWDEERNKRIIVSKEAELLRNDTDGGVISLSLVDVTVHTTEKKRNDFTYSTADRMVYNILLRDMANVVASIGPRETMSWDLWPQIVEKKKQVDEQIVQIKNEVRRAEFALTNYYDNIINEADRKPGGYFPNLQSLQSRAKSQLDQVRLKASKKPQLRSLPLYLLEFHKKFSVPFGCVCFICFAFPVGLFSRRSGRSVGFGVGIFVSGLYWLLLMGGQTLGQKNSIPPELAMWMPNLVMLILGGFAAFRKRGL